MKFKAGSFRLLITISALFTGLIVIFGVTISQYAFQSTSQIIFQEEEKQFELLSDELSMEFDNKINIVDQSVQILSQTGVMDAATFEQRLQYVPLFAEALNPETKISALQVGYDNGDFFIVRGLLSERHRNHFNAPPTARYVVDNIITSYYGQRLIQRVWYTEYLHELQRSGYTVTDYDPRVRPWYILALSSDKPVSSDPYFFHFIKKTGITIAYRPLKKRAVIAGDITLETLSGLLSESQKTPNTEIYLLEKKGGQYFVLATNSPKHIEQSTCSEKRCLASEYPSPILQAAALLPDVLSTLWELNFEKEEWLGATRKLPIEGRDNFYLVTITPEKELLAGAKSIQDQAIKFTVAMLLITILVTWFIANRISTPIRNLAKDADDIRLFRFNSKKPSGSVIKEINDLEKSMYMMQTTISKFLSLIESLSNEQDFSKLLDRITKETMLISGADSGFAYVFNETNDCLVPGSVKVRDDIKMKTDLLPVIEISQKTSTVDIFQNGKRVITTLADVLGSEEKAAAFNLNEPQVVVIPLTNRQNENIGMLCLVYDKHRLDIHSEENQGRLALIEALSGFAAVTLESRKMILMQKELLESFIKLMAGAIDSKSPYTGGHCQRVPILTKLLAQKACDQKEGPFADFSLSEEAWEEIHIASWLHDCGKVTTPEYVVDKATKLETIYDRIHEVRMRFEVLKRDAHINCLEQFLPAGETNDDYKKKLNEEWQQLDDDFAFIAECNLGGEFMAPEKIERLKKIASRTWVRTISDRLGISWVELDRKNQTPEPEMPAVEPLLSDRQDHLLERNQQNQIDQDNPYGFKVDIPEHQFNRGELYNLSITKGTLTDEERFYINDHIIQTIIMLNKLPFPKHLANVPDIAGGHHEKIDGTGYPRKLTGDQMSVKAKMMVIADIFEALTASDRPYKKAKTLSESIRIMGFMLKDNHIDEELFKLFLTSGAYREYAEQYLKPEQIDEVDIEKYL